MKKGGAGDLSCERGGHVNKQQWVLMCLLTNIVYLGGQNNDNDERAGIACGRCLQEPNTFLNLLPKSDNDLNNVHLDKQAECETRDGTGISSITLIHFRGGFAHLPPPGVLLKKKEQVCHAC
jgi:hypothetical protein